MPEIEKTSVQHEQEQSAVATSDGGQGRRGLGRLRFGTIRARLLLSFIAAVALVGLLVSVIYILLGFRSSRQQVIDSLDLVISLKENQAEAWVDGLENELASLVLEEGNLVREQARVVLDLSPEVETEVEAAKPILRSLLQDVIATSRRFDELLVTDREGTVVIASDPAQENQWLGEETYFQFGIQRPYVQPLSISPSDEQATLVVAQPISDEFGNIVGVLVGRASIYPLGTIMSQRTGLGGTGVTYLVDADGRMLTIPRSQDSLGTEVQSPGVVQAIEERERGSAVYEDYRGVPVIGAFHWLPNLEVALLAEQEQSEAFEAVYQGIGYNVGVALIALILVAFGSRLLARSIANPIVELADTATEIASGDLTRTARVVRNDEIGALARAFNSMTVQLRELIASLEQRVADRTRALEQRAVQLATASDVGRAAASILNLETLAHQVVDLIRQRFGFYYTGLFLVDDAGRYAVLEAGTGEPGRIMKEQGHKLRVGGVSMVGAACAQHEARIALDVGAEAVRFDNPLLPETRSEMALPLMVGDRVLGALDVQSTEPAAFSDEDIAVLQLVADQVAVAVDNARKFSEEATLLEVANPLFRVSRRLAAANTTEEIVQAILSSVAETEADGCAVALFGSTDGQGADADTVTFLGAWHRWRELGVPLGVPLPVEEANFPPSLATSFWTVEDVSEDERISEARRRALVENEVWAVVNVPLRLGDSVIGFVDVQRATAGPFSPVSVRLYETLTDQAAVALERGRLLEESQRRAERERLISEIAGRMRGSLDMETVLHTTVDEVYQALDLKEVVVRLVADEADGDGGSGRREGHVHQA